MSVSTETLAEILGAALGALEEGIGVLDAEARVVFWSPAAAAISGYPSAELLARELPPDCYEIDLHHHGPCEAGQGERPLLVHLRHRQGHSLPVMLRRTALRDALGRRFGTLLRFHPMEEIDALPHGDTVLDDDHEHRVEQSQAGMEDRLDEAWQEWKTNAVPFGLLWVDVDQAATLRRTHGRDAAEAMLAIVERTLLHGLRPAEMLGRWGTHEFLVICHERTMEMLRSHGQHLAALVRTADFRWWGDRVPLTASVGVAQAGETDGTETLSGLLRKAQLAMRGNAAVSIRAV